MRDGTVTLTTILQEDLMKDMGKKDNIVTKAKVLKFD